MKLHNIINKQCCFFMPGEIFKETILEKLVYELYQHSNLKNENIPLNEIMREVVARETTHTTGIGKGLAFPHARLDSIKGVYVSIGISSTGLGFESLDNEKAHFFVLTLVPKNNPGILLKIRAALIDLLIKEEVREKVFNSTTPETLHELITQRNFDLDTRIIAANIMKACPGKITPEMTLQEAAIQFHTFETDSLPIISGKSQFQGALCCHDLFSYKLPDFFHTLHSISFLKQMDPFEKYFQADTQATIKELQVDKKQYTIEPNATLMEIIFEFTVKNKEILYVVERDQLLGMIDRYSVIDKILLLNMENLK